LNGRPIINHVLDALYAAGVRDATLVLGYRGEQIRKALADVHPCGMTLRFVQNEDFDLGNARSLWAAREDGSFVLAMADHLVEPALISALVDGADGRCRLAVDRAAPGDPRADEATRAWVDGGHVRDLGKEIRLWNAFDTGAFWCTPRVFEVLTPERRDGEMSAVFASLAREGELEATDVTGRLWLDIDTPGDLQMAESLVAHGRLP
jgi:choline kinase